MAYIPKSFLSGGLLFSYLILGSGTNVVDQPTKLTPRQIIFNFAQTVPRKIYKYSVVPGGVESPEELAEARRNDPVVAANFADFGTHTYITHLQQDMYVYVAYRVGNKVYYTKKKHKVCKGEEIITDGKNSARTRCANRITKVFKAPNIVFNEPKPPELDILEPPESPYLDVPDNPLITQNYNPYPRIEEYQAPKPEPIASSGASPLPKPVLPSEVILPGIQPIAGGVAPPLFSPGPASTGPGGGGAGGGSGGTGGGGTGGGGTGGGGGGTGSIVPEPSTLAFLLLSSSVFFLLKKKNRSA